MEKSDQINELMAELAKAQGAGDRFIEGLVLPKILKEISPLKQKNQHSVSAFPMNFFEKIAFGASDCWYWRGALNSAGYGTIKKEKAHRFSYKIFKGKIQKKMGVLHSCDVPNCVNPEHLWVGTQKDNMQDCSKKGRTKTPLKFGEDCGASKLKKSQVLMIRKIKKQTGAKSKDIAILFNVSAQTVLDILNNKTWKNV